MNIKIGLVPVVALTAFLFSQPRAAAASASPSVSSSNLQADSSTSYRLVEKRVYTTLEKAMREGDGSDADDAFIRIETRRTVLRRIAMDRRDQTIKLLSDIYLSSKIWPMMRGDSPSQTDINAIVKGSSLLRRSRYLPGQFDFIIDLKSESGGSRTIGHLCFYPTGEGVISALRQARTDEAMEGRWFSIAYFIDPKYWGQGIMSETLQAAIDFVSDHYCLSGICAEVRVDNEKSQKLLIKTGFEEFHEGAHDYWRHLLVKRFYRPSRHDASLCPRCAPIFERFN